ncbi:TetR/AcrR family transcriptional regulator [Kitasatospora sp. NPDC089509]|uniref:TetR/AcrR family transcriptional regulator n=1 Tax=Kitasatospora sp. NPDC089509 TaxID=3364079 RepID=UPI0037F1B2C0
MASFAPGQRRAPAMTPEGRREMIVRAALPLVIEYGTSVTTAQIARAAGIGEGTVFRVFSDKDSLLAACLAEALRPDDAVGHLAAIDPEQPLADRLVEAAEAIGGYLARMAAVSGALAASGGAQGRAPQSSDRDGEPAGRERLSTATTQALAALFEPERDNLLMPPEQLAVAFQLLIMAAGLQGGTGPAPLSYRDVVELLLHGALLRKEGQ